jgi:uncharacterized membrane protein
MRQALDDPQLLGGILTGASWQTWRTMLIAAMGEPLTDLERKVFRQFTGRAREPNQRIEEAAFVVGRRGGKDRAAAILATYIAGLCDHSVSPPISGKRPSRSTMFAPRSSSRRSWRS